MNLGRNIKAFLSLFVLISCIPLFGAVAQAENTPMSDMRQTINKLIKIVEALPGKSNLKQRREELRATIIPRFDFREMAKRSLGAHWKKASVDQREEFVRVFSELLARTYLSRIENVGSGMVMIESEKVKDQKALVRTKVTHKNDVFPINYKLILKKGEWKVYDVIIENIGLVANYRNEFAGIIRKEQFPGLLKRLQKKVEA